MLRISLIIAAVLGVAVVMFAKIDGLRAQSMRRDVATPVCVYDGRSFSEGAHICVQKSLMMKCIMNDEKPLWTLVLDKDLGSYCLTSLQRDAMHIVRRPHPRLAAPASASTACFTFNGKHYCE
jgi:hypothetical protein